MGWKRYCSPLLSHSLQDIQRLSCRIYRVFEYKMMLFLCTASKDSKDLTFCEVEHYVCYPNKTLNSVCWSGRYEIEVRVSHHSPTEQILDVTKMLFCY